MDKTIVGKFLDTFGGGKEFFDAIDHHIKHDRTILQELYDMPIINAFYDARIIMSGEIAIAAHNFGFRVDVIVNGGLRNGAPIIDLSSFVKPKDVFIFIDDSYYSGKTFHAVSQEVERCGGKVFAAVVAYDGCPYRIDKLYSLYSYYQK